MRSIAATALFAVNLINKRVAAECWDSGPNPPQYPIQLVEHLLTAGYMLQSIQTLRPGIENRFVYSQDRNKDDKNCFTFEVKNNGKGPVTVDSVGAMDSWLRELMACDHGSHRDYGSLYYA